MCKTRTRVELPLTDRNTAHIHYCLECWIALPVHDVVYIHDMWYATGMANYLHGIIACIPYKPVAFTLLVKHPTPSQLRPKMHDLHTVQLDYSIA